MDLKKKSTNFTKLEIDALMQETELRNNDLFGKFGMNLTADTKSDSWGKVAENERGVGRHGKKCKIRQKVNWHVKLVEVERDGNDVAYVIIAVIWLHPHVAHDFDLCDLHL